MTATISLTRFQERQCCVLRRQPILPRDDLPKYLVSLVSGITASGSIVTGYMPSAVRGMDRKGMSVIVYNKLKSA